MTLKCKILEGIINLRKMKTYTFPSRVPQPYLESVLFLPCQLAGYNNNDNLIPRWFNKARVIFYSSPEIMKHLFISYRVKYNNIINEANDVRQQLSTSLRT